MFSALKQTLAGAVVSATLFAIFLCIRNEGIRALADSWGVWLLVTGIGALGAAAGNLVSRAKTPTPDPDEEEHFEPTWPAALPPALPADKAVATTRVAPAQEQDRLLKVRQDLARLKESYRDLYHNAPVMYFSLDATGRLVTFNDTLVRTLGYQREQLAGRPYKDLLAPLARADWEQRLRLSGQGNHQVLPIDDEVETLWHTKNGDILDIWIRSVPVLNEDGKIVRFRSAALDFTERNRLAHELRKRGDELERTNTRLRQINAELEDFTHVVSHDLKEPLRTLHIYSNILAEDFSGQLGPDGFQSINHLIQASRRLGHLIDDLLTLGQAGRITGALQIFDLIEVVATVRNDLVDMIQRKGATVLTEGSLPTVTGDQPRITQLLANLVANGLKYNNTPVPQVVIGQVVDEAAPGAPEDLDPSQAIIYVRDNGIGIDPHFHQKIFRIFHRLHQPGEFEGTGAGLAICKKIVQAHRGCIWVDSTLGKGATFYFTLPRPVAPPQPGPPQRNGIAQAAKVQHQRVAGPVARPDLQPDPTPTPALVTTILLVENDEATGLIIQRLTAKSDLQVTCFTNAEDAWNYLQSHQPELLLLDIDLPGMTGIDLCKKVRGELQRSAVPIVLFSPEENPEELDRLHAAGANFVLSKDLLIEPGLWQKKIKEILPDRVVAEDRRG